MIASILRFLNLDELACRWEHLGFIIKSVLVIFLILLIGGALLVVLFLTGQLNFDPSWNMGEGGILLLFGYLGICLFLPIAYILIKIFGPLINKINKIRFPGDISKEELEEMSDEQKRRLLGIANETLIHKYFI